ncbi:hypothetical protein LCGC14_0653830 [marine sediment metagenome]|uniref:Uncharacterized protein n=1 Tax=marine sediment metagenome TaxID=412755 RepID=A0A0F9U3Z6_9ZZZZ
MPLSTLPEPKPNPIIFGHFQSCYERNEAAVEALLSDIAVNTLEDAARTDPNDTDSARSTTTKFRNVRDVIQQAENLQREE